MKDFLLDDNGELITPLKRGESTGQHQALLLMAAKGSFKETPNATVGIGDYINENELDDMVFDVRRKFEADGMKVTSINYNEQTGDLSYEASYNK